MILNSSLNFLRTLQDYQAKGSYRVLRVLMVLRAEEEHQRLQGFEARPVISSSRSDQ
jgi:hypothetical protein